MTILVADDDKMHVHLLTALLKKREFSVSLACDGAVYCPGRASEPDARDQRRRMNPEECRLASDDSPLDHAAALRRTEGDAELLSDLVRIFLDDCPRLVSKIRTAVSNAAPKQIEHAAHELKGCLGNFSAAPAFEAAEKLEMLARDGQIADAEIAAGQLEAELGRLHPALERLLTRPI